MKNKDLLCRTIFYVLFLLVVACAVTAGCLLRQFPVASYVLFGAAAFALVAQPFVALIFCRGKTSVKGFRQWCTAIEVTAVYVIFVVFSPLLVLLLVVDAAKRKSLGKHSELDK